MGNSQHILGPWLLVPLFLDLTFNRFFSFLDKRGKANQAFQERWFVLSNKELNYYRVNQSSRRSHKGMIPIGNSVIRRPLEVGRKNEFEIITPQRVYYIRADNDKDLFNCLRILKQHSLVIVSFRFSKLVVSIFALMVFVFLCFRQVQEENTTFDNIQMQIDELEFMVATSNQKAVESVSTLSSVLKNKASLMSNYVKQGFIRYLEVCALLSSVVVGGISFSCKWCIIFCFQRVQGAENIHFWDAAEDYKVKDSRSEEQRRKRYFTLGEI